LLPVVVQIMGRRQPGIHPLDAAANGIDSKPKWLVSVVFPAMSCYNTHSRFLIQERIFQPSEGEAPPAKIGPLPFFMPSL
jgi:hypothetical protein